MALWVSKVRTKWMFVVLTILFSPDTYKEKGYFEQSFCFVDF